VKRISIATRPVPTRTRSVMNSPLSISARAAFRHAAVVALCTWLLAACGSSAVPRQVCPVAALPALAPVAAEGTVAAHPEATELDEAARLALFDTLAAAIAERHVFSETTWSVNFGRTWSSRLPGLRELFREARDADALEGALTRLGNSLHDPHAVYDSPRRPARSSRLPPPRPGWSHDLGHEGGPMILANGTRVGPAAAVRPRVATGQVRASWSGTAASTARSTTAPRTPTPAGSKPEQRPARRVPGGSAPSPRPSGRVLSIGAIIDGISARGPPTERRGA